MKSLVSSVFFCSLVLFGVFDFCSGLPKGVDPTVEITEGHVTAFISHLKNKNKTALESIPQGSPLAYLWIVINDLAKSTVDQIDVIRKNLNEELDKLENGYLIIKNRREELRIAAEGYITAWNMASPS